MIVTPTRMFYNVRRINGWLKIISLTVALAFGLVLLRLLTMLLPYKLNGNKAQSIILIRVVKWWVVLKLEILKWVE